MKKTILSIAMAVGFGTAQAGWISYDLDQVKADAKGGSDSQAHYIRAGGSVAGFNTMMQARTASFDKGGMVHSVELTAGKQLGPVSPFVGVGHDLGFNGSKSFQYGLIGVNGVIERFESGALLAIKHQTVHKTRNHGVVGLRIGKQDSLLWFRFPHVETLFGGYNF